MLESKEYSAIFASSASFSMRAFSSSVDVLYNVRVKQIITKSYQRDSETYNVLDNVEWKLRHQMTPTTTAKQLMPSTTLQWDKLLLNYTNNDSETADETDILLISSVHDRLAIYGGGCSSPPVQ